MPIVHICIALIVVLVWGLNFIFVKFGLDEMSPFLLCGLRFVLSSIPAVFFIKFPKGSFNLIAIYGLVMFCMQFGLLFLGIKVGMTPGMASLIGQTQVFFSIFFAAVFLKEKPKLLQLIGACISFLGIGLVAMNFDAEVTLSGFLLILSAAASWGMGNLITKKIQATHFIAIIVWGSFISCFPMLLLALIVDGPQSFVFTYEHISWKGIGALLYIVYASTWIGYGLWNWLISRYPVSVVVPFVLLVPVVGMLSSAIILSEPLQSWKIIAAFLVIGGLCINLFSTRVSKAKQVELKT